MGNTNIHKYDYEYDKRKAAKRKQKQKKNKNTKPASADVARDQPAVATHEAENDNNNNICSHQAGTLFEDFEQVLPDEILISIFMRCDEYALSVVAPKVCKQFYNNTLPDGYLWQQKCKLRNRRLLSGRIQQNRTFKYIYITQSKIR